MGYQISVIGDQQEIKGFATEATGVRRSHGELWESSAELDEFEGPEIVEMYDADNFL